MATTKLKPTGADADVRRDTEATTKSLKRILVALDASDHANRALEEAARLAASTDGVVTGIHAYAAKLHDRRFRQMEGGLPERYQQEQEMEHQRDVHDDLISRGLNIISDSYHDAGQAVCDRAGVAFRRLSPEGKNYSQIVDAARSGEFDLLAMGAVGLGAQPGDAVGTVCERVVRRAPIDTLIVREPKRAVGDGPVVVCIDGSPRSFGGLMIALNLAQRLGGEVHAIAAYDPYYHYVAFNKISGVLSDEAGKVFRFKEQEKLHEELIDDGIAKIYQSQLEVARTIAEDLGASISCQLLDGKPYRAIVQYLKDVGASLVVLGRTGVHADDALDIGGNAENVLRQAPCHVWLTDTSYRPPLDLIAEETIAWSEEAEERIAKAPEFVRGMARTAVHRYAQEQGHTFITSDIVSEVMAKMMPGFSGSVESGRTLDWSKEAEALLAGLKDDAAADTVRLRATKRARRDKAEEVLPEHVRPFLAENAADALTWTAAALARVERVPEMVRRTVRIEIEDVARERDQAEVTLELAEQVIAEVRTAMCPVPEHGAENGDGPG